MISLEKHTVSYMGSLGLPAPALFTVLAIIIEIGAGSPALIQLANATPPMDDARMKALQQCGAMEKKYTQETWGVQQLDMYRACMAQRGQQE